MLKIYIFRKLKVLYLDKMNHSTEPHIIKGRKPHNGLLCGMNKKKHEHYIYRVIV